MIAGKFATVRGLVQTLQKTITSYNAASAKAVHAYSNKSGFGDQSNDDTNSEPKSVNTKAAKEPFVQVPIVAMTSQYAEKTTDRSMPTPEIYEPIQIEMSDPFEVADLESVNYEDMLRWAYSDRNTGRVYADVTIMRPSVIVFIVASGRTAKDDGFNMEHLLILMLSLATSLGNPSPSFGVNFGNIKDEIYEQPVDLMMSASPKKSPHLKAQDETPGVPKTQTGPEFTPFDFSKLDSFLGAYQEDEARDHNRLKRRAKRRRGRGGRRRNRYRNGSTYQPDDSDRGTNSSTDVPIARMGEHALRSSKTRKSNSKGNNKKKYDMYEPKMKEYESDFVEMPKDLYQAHLRPGVIFRIHMSEAILKMQYRNYGENKDESVIEADVEYLRLTRKVISDEITKFEDLKWLIGWFNNRSELMQEHMCNVRYIAVGIPPTMFTHSEEYMKRMCLFDNVYIDHIPYVVGEDNSLMAAVAPPVLHCDAATCTSVPFIDSLMFDERLPKTNVRTVTRCQASCRAHCRNDPDCLKRCSERCLRAEKK